MAQKFDRNYKLTIHPRSNLPFGPLTEDQFNAQTDIVIEPPFTMEFEINRIGGGLASASNARITIYNLNLEHRMRLNRAPGDTFTYQGLELSAGYGTGVPSSLLAAFKTAPIAKLAAEQAQLFPRIFRGNITEAYSVRNGVNFLTTIVAQDGGWGRVNGQVSQAFSGGTPYRQMLAQLIKGMSLDVGAIGNFPGSLPEGRGNTLVGSPLDTILAITNGSFFIDQEKGYCLNDNEYITGAVNLIDDSTGLLGTPRIQTGIINGDNGQLKEMFVTVETLFEPGLTLGQGVELRSVSFPSVNGFYKVIGVQHRGIISPSVCGAVKTTVQLTNGQLFTLVG